MTNRIPKTAADALRMAKCWEKAMHLIEEGYRFINLLKDVPVPGHTLVAVYKTQEETTPTYWITAGFSNMQEGCSCPDFVKHGKYCKHTLCWEDMESMEAAIAEYEKQQADAECANGVDSLL